MNTSIKAKRFVERLISDSIEDDIKVWSYKGVYAAISRGKKYLIHSRSRSRKSDSELFAYVKKNGELLKDIPDRVIETIKDHNKHLDEIAEYRQKK